MYNSVSRKLCQLWPDLGPKYICINYLYSHLESSRMRELILRLILGPEELDEQEIQFYSILMKITFI